jgi:hypothetical protein
LEANFEDELRQILKILPKVSINIMLFYFLFLLSLSVTYEPVKL